MIEKPNLNYIKELSEGDIIFEQKIINVLKKDYPIELESFKENFLKKQYIEASDNVHKLKHKISILGLEKSYKLASDFENEIKKGETRLYNSFIKILEVIRKFLDNQ
jgi:hypothetical protein